MIYDEFLEIMENMYQDVDYTRPIRVIDEDGFLHEVHGVVWDESDKCFYITTRWRI